MNALDGEPFPRPSPARHYASSASELYERWNVAFQPWRKPPFRFSFARERLGSFQIRYTEHRPTQVRWSGRWRL